MSEAGTGATGAPPLGRADCAAPGPRFNKQTSTGKIANMAAAGTSFQAIARRYVTALFSLAESGKALDAAARDLDAFAALLKESPELARFVYNPLASRAQQQAAMASLLKQGRAHGLSVKFFAELAKARRLSLIPEIARQFREKLAETQGQVTAEVTSAGPLPKTQQDAIAKALAKVTGKDIRLEVKEDPGILGGLVVKVGGRMLDGSLSGRLSRLQMAMKTQISQR